MLGRVVKRYPYSPNLAFLDVTGTCETSYSLILESQALVDIVNKCRVGDLVAFNGSLAVNSKEEWHDMRVSVNASSIEIVETWNTSASGSLLIEWEDFRRVNLSDVPNFFIQCDHATVDRLLSYIPATLSRKSFSSLSSTRDRIIAAWTDLNDFESKILADKFLGAAIRRVYPMRTNDTIVHISHPSLFESVSSALTYLSNTCKLRVQVFPKHLTGAVLKRVETGRVTCDPREFNTVLNVVLADAVFHTSLVSRNFISSQVGSPHSICRAESKIEEALTRRGWNLNGTRLAVDVGAAPGGWSNYLASLVTQVIAVDKGDVICQSERVIHLRMSGDTAIAQLAESGERIDFFCCDANIQPETTLSIFKNACQIFRGRFVLTLKNTYRLKKDWEASVEGVMYQLASSGCTEVQLDHLLSNTQLEITVSGVYNST